MARLLVKQGLQALDPLAALNVFLPRALQEVLGCCLCCRSLFGLLSCAVLSYHLRFPATNLRLLKRCSGGGVARAQAQIGSPPGWTTRRMLRGCLHLSRCWPLRSCRQQCRSRR